MSDAQWEEPCCMFVKDCNTGSQLRKAISHLFGRNKSCTLRIPKKVWVYYCRKHYQRVRYRNSKTYPLNQMDLVKLQIRRLQAWSEENQRGGNGPHIRSWALSLRKREKNRLSQGVDAAGEGDNQGVAAAPEWLIQRLGSGYTTEQMMEVAVRLYEEIEDGTLGQVPEVEFLPDITGPEDGSSSGRPRKQSDPAPPPKRKASEIDAQDEEPTKRARIDTLMPSLLSPGYPRPPRLPPLATDFRPPPPLLFDPTQRRTYRQPEFDSAQPVARWNRDHNGHIRLPSISAQLEDVPSVSPMRPFLRSQEVRRPTFAPLRPNTHFEQYEGEGVWAQQYEPGEYWRSARPFPGNLYGPY